MDFRVTKLGVHSVHERSAVVYDLSTVRQQGRRPHESSTVLARIAAIPVQARRSKFSWKNEPRERGGKDALEV